MIRMSVVAPIVPIRLLLLGMIASIVRMLWRVRVIARRALLHPPDLMYLGSGRFQFLLLPLHLDPHVVYLSRLILDNVFLMVHKFDCFCQNLPFAAFTTSLGG